MPSTYFSTFKRDTISQKVIKYVTTPKTGIIDHQVFHEKGINPYSVTGAINVANKKHTTDKPATPARYKSDTVSPAMGIDAIPIIKSITTVADIIIIENIFDDRVSMLNNSCILSPKSIKIYAITNPATNRKIHGRMLRSSFILFLPV
jgi:hypothetical protein